MKPNFYLEVRIKNLDLGIPSSEGIPPSIIIANSKLISVFHSFMFNKEKNIAISFPEYSCKEYRKIGFTVRFFTEERESFDELIDYFENNDFILKHFDIRGVKKVNLNNVLNYSAFIARKIPRRYNVSNGKNNGLNIENYIARCEYLHSLPNLRLKSSSNKNYFSIFIERKNTTSIEKNDGTLKNDSGKLNSYGFSLMSSDEFIYLPNF